MIELFLFTMLFTLFALIIFMQSKHLANQVKSSTAIIVPPKYRMWGTIGFYAFWIGLVTILFTLQSQFESYFSVLEKNCEMYMGFNTTYFRNLKGLSILVIASITVAYYNFNRYSKIKLSKGKFYPSPEIQPKFIRNVCKIVNKQFLREEKGNIVINITCVGILVFSYLSAPIKPLFPISQSNEAYQQACVSEIVEINKAEKD